MVLGLLAGGVARGAIVTTGVFISSLFFAPTTIHNFLWLIYFVITISVIFACAGMIGALWAEDFGMLTIWNTYVIIPLVLLGGVFHPVTMLPQAIQFISKFNPMFYLVSGMRYSMTGVTQTSVLLCAAVSLSLALISFYSTVFLFKIGYKLRT